MRTGILTGVAVVVCLGLAGGAAAEKLERIKTEVFFVNAEFGIYEGELDADPPCQKNRRITVYHDENSNDLADPEDFVINRDKTDENGDFLVMGNQAPPGDHIIVIAEGKKREKKGVHCLRGFGDAVALQP